MGKLILILLLRWRSETLGLKFSETQLLESGLSVPSSRSGARDLNSYRKQDTAQIQPPSASRLSRVRIPSLLAKSAASVIAMVERRPQSSADGKPGSPTLPLE